ncbi:hypothetical protein [Scleromatobacter humisilvae]|uniref:Uncharacterized protein n=1 Tax=Scleromatobacter humisilvae TaxID=2897159 RepID=A0A9X1YF27_9BURK|nr:hypothetical protein [Scleromatobacter humisilvae]MCK9684761.1 hypothetical protein [Scleromatobacter humisilvae]
MRRLAPVLAIVALAAAVLPRLAAADDTPRERVRALEPDSLDRKLARFTALARLQAPQPAGAFELRIWRVSASHEFGALFADGQWRFLGPGPVQERDTRDVVRREETIVTVKAPDAAVVESTRALMAFDHRMVSCDNMLDGVFVVVQASVDGHPLLLGAANPMWCRGEMAARVTSLLDAVDAVQAPYRVAPD